MGQGQSSASSSGAAGGAQEVKTSYYVLLGVERTATEEEIKKAYRRKALELHPDRNYGNEEEATKTFAEVQSAYEILSDPQERAWYDSHESAILRGDDAADGNVPTYEDVRVTTADDLARLVRKFNSSVEFSDSPSGFFGFVRETFDQLAKEEEIAANWENVDVHEYPSFGHKADDYNDVVKSFYAAWSGFSTVKSFSWCDRYRLSEAPDRFIRRRMEQENQKLRKDGKQEFNEAVRALVAFIKKRDPRFVPNTQTEEERQKVLRDSAASQAARARAANAAKISEDAVPDWAKFREPEELEESSEEEIEEQILECVACNKTFKSERQWEAHEKSKKHIKAVKTLQHKMRKQNAHLNLDEDGVSSGVATPDDEEDDDEENGGRDVVDQVDEEHLDDHVSISEDEPEDVKSDSDEHGPDHSRSASEKDAKESTDKTNAAEESEEATDSADEDYASKETIQARMQSVSLDTPASTASEDDAQPTKKMGKAAQKRAKKAAAAAAAGKQAEAAPKCQVCGEEFSSKTKLFRHIEDEGHAALKSATSATGKGKKAKGKR